MPEYLPGKQGFDYWFGIDHHQNGPVKAPSVATDTEKSGNKPDRRRPWCSLYRNDTVIEENPDMLYFTKRFTKEAVTFISKNKDNPFFLYYATNVPHTPLYATGDFAGKSKRGLYGDMVEEFDWSVGEVLETLKKLGIDKNTLVLFISDNGPWLTQRLRGGSAGLLRDGKNSTFEGGMRVPAIAWWPDKIKPNSVSSSLAATMDILPTFARLSDSGLPGERELDGMDITDLLLGKKDQVREWIYYYINKNLYAIRNGSWKAHFITHPSYSPETPAVHETPLLYNVDTDPSEKYDVAGQYPDIVKALSAAFKKQNLIVPAPSEIDKELDIKIN
jgi:arylsulfatase A